LKTHKLIQYLFIASLLLILSCTKNTGSEKSAILQAKEIAAARDEKPSIAQAKKAPSAPDGWNQAIIVDQCGPTDGIISQIRFGWQINKQTNALTQHYPSMLMAYRKTNEGHFEVYSNEYCSSVNTCSSIPLKDVHLSANPTASDGSFIGTYEMKLPSGKSISGQFKIKKEDRISLDLLCG
jgi:hypothetical protein